MKDKSVPADDVPLRSVGNSFVNPTFVPRRS